MANEIEEVVVMVHGVQQRREPGSNAGNYADLFNGISDRLPAGSAWKRARMVEVEWGKDDPDAPDPAANHRKLSAAQRNYADATLKAAEEEREPTLNPARRVISGLRPTCVRGFGDMFYYVSADGKASLRRTLVRYLAGRLSGGLAGSDGDLPTRPLSLTFVGHSAGAVICADFLFYLFHEARSEEDYLGQACGPERHLPGGLPPLDTETRENLATLKARAEDGTLRVRRLITLGSPFSMVLARSAAVVERLAASADARLDPADYGLTGSKADEPGSAFGGALDGPRWINVWDKDDLIAYPVEPVFPGPGADGGAAVVDVNVNVGSGVTTVHNAYWQDRKVWAALAGRW